MLVTFKTAADETRVINTNSMRDMVIGTPDASELCRVFVQYSVGPDDEFYVDKDVADALTEKFAFHADVEDGVTVADVNGRRIVRNERRGTVRSGPLQ